jgi:hypothetical protein
MEEDKKWFNNPLQYNYYLAEPDSKTLFPELNKDLSISNLSKKMQRVCLIKGRVANYILMVSELIEERLKKDEKMKVNEKIQFKSYVSFVRDVMAIGVTSQGLDATLLTKLTEQSSRVQHSYAMDDKYKKNIGGN